MQKTLEAAIDAEQLIPYVMSVSYRQGDVMQMRTDIRWCLPSAEPDPFDLVPEDAKEFKVDVFSASRFGDMDSTVRPLYLYEYRVYLMAFRARTLGKAISEMLPWVDYDPISIDYESRRWANPGVRFTGD